MSFKENLIKARGHIVFLTALLFGLALVLFLESRETGADNDSTEHAEMTINALAAFDNVDPLPLTVPRPATEQDLEYARIAWTYFENNTNPETGLVNSVDNYPSTTMWETGSYFIAVVSANRLGLIEEEEAIARISRAIDTLSQQRLFDDVLPNKAYNVNSNELVDYSNQPSERGLGWSALDIARIIVALQIAEQHYPELAPDVRELTDRWDLSLMVRDGQLVGGNLAEDNLREDQEGRVGYEQYAAKAMLLLGYDMYTAYDVSATLMVREVEGLPIPVDSRLHRNITPAFVVSEPYVFDGLEFGFDQRSHRFATAIYLAQENRYINTGILTAVSESHIDEAPYFVYSTIWGGGAPWAVMTFSGDRADSRRTLATKTAFAWNALFETEYTGLLIEAVSEIADPERGWREGIYEIDGSINGSITANTNAVVLAALSYRSFGPLLETKK